MLYNHTLNAKLKIRQDNLCQMTSKALKKKKKVFALMKFHMNLEVILLKEDLKKYLQSSVKGMLLVHNQLYNN